MVGPMGPGNSPRIRNVAIAAALVFPAAVGALVRYEAGYPLSPLELFGRNSSAEGRRELRALRRDPVLDVRAPSTRLRSAREVPAGKDWWNAEQPTEIRRLFTLQGEPGDAVDVYRARAEAGGWQLVEARCSFSHRSTSVTLTRTVAGRPATLLVYGYLERPPPASQIRGLLVSLTGEAPDRPPQGPGNASLRPRNIHCLRDFDPTSPALLPPARLPGSSAEICGLLTLAEAKRVVPAVGSVKPSVNSGPACWYDDVAKGGFTVLAAKEPMAYYEDRAIGVGSPFLVIADTTSDRPRGAWVDTRIGPVEIYGGATPSRPGLDTGQIVALAELLAR